jgi:DNA repair protein RecN (Recombination protein N)
VEAVVHIDGERRVVERTVSAAGRSSARLDGEPATIDQLLELGARVVDIHGQSEQLAILRPAVQLAALDAFAGLEAKRGAFVAGVRELRAVRRELRELSAEGRERERLLDQLRFESEEIASAALRPGEDAELQAERNRLASAARLMEDAARALDALDGPQLAEAAAAVADILARDPSAAALADAAAALETAIHDLSRALRAYTEALEEDPERLTAIEERLDRIARLKRKYGATVEEVLAYGEAAAARLAAMAGSEERLAALRAREGELLAELGSMAATLSVERRSAAARLKDELAGELARLGMAGASLEVAFTCDDDPAGVPVDLPDYELAGAGTLPSGDLQARAFTETGVDRVEFLASFNPGEPARPLGAVASGGETSRFLLALTTVLGNAAEPRLVVFDEVDEGVGGRAGSLVGAALRKLAERHQVLCLTHLPQVAAFGERHFVVTKSISEGGTFSEVRCVDGDERIAELAAMVGGGGEASVSAARELLERTSRG